jgi:hypothetical protein
MSLWNEPLELDFPELFSSMDRTGFPQVSDAEQGIRIYADNLSYEDNLLSCNLLITFSFKRAFATRFQRIGQALNVIVENADTGQSAFFNLNDPHKKYPSIKGDNLLSEPKSIKKGRKTSYREIPLTIELNNPGWGPHLFVRVALQAFVSNILAVDVSEEPRLSSYLNDEPYSVDLEDEDDV